MKLSLHYILAFTLLVPPLAIWAGGDCVRQDIVEECFVCRSQRRSTERHWCIWSFAGNEQVTGEIQASRLFQDFPDLTCEHCWRESSAETSHPWDGLLWELHPPPRKSVDWMRFPPPAAFYQDGDVFRQRVLDAIEDGVVSRKLMLAWLMEAGTGSEDPREEAALRALWHCMHRTARPYFWVPLPLVLPSSPRIDLDPPAPWPAFSPSPRISHEANPHGSPLKGSEPSR